MNRNKRLIEILLKDKVSKTILETILTTADICYLDGRKDEREGVDNLNYIEQK